MTLRPNDSDVVIRAAGELGPCSAWPEQVGGDPLRVGGLVGQHRHLGRSGQQVDAHPAEELPLGLGDEGVARADEHVDRCFVEQAEGHGAQRLHAADGEHPVGPRQVGAVEHRGVGAVFARRWRARQHRRHAGGLGHADGHERACQKREATGGQVRADAATGMYCTPPATPGASSISKSERCVALRRREAVGALIAEFEGLRGRRRAGRRRSSAARRRTPRGRRSSRRGPWRRRGRRRGRRARWCASISETRSTTLGSR